MLITIGIDIGQVSDPTTIAMTELQWRLRDQYNPTLREYTDHHLVRWLEAMPLKTPYPKVVERLDVLISTVRERVKYGNLVNAAGWLIPEDEAEVEVYVDATGVGAPLVDMLEQRGLNVIGVYFTGEDMRREVIDPQTHKRVVRLGKTIMVSRLQSLLQTRRLHLPNTPEAKIVARQLLDFELRTSQAGRTQAGAFKEGTHDDYVTALGLCTNKMPAYTGMASEGAMADPMQIPPGNLPERVADFWTRQYGIGTGGSTDLGKLTNLPNDPSLRRPF